MTAYVPMIYCTSSELYHHGIKGQKWGVRRYQNPDGSLTALGRKKIGRRQDTEIKKLNKLETKYNKAVDKAYKKESKALTKGNVKRLAKATNKREVSKEKQKEAKKKLEASTKAVSQYTMRDFKMEKDFVKSRKRANRVYNAIVLASDILLPTPTSLDYVVSSTKDLKQEYREQYLKDKKKYGGNYSDKTEKAIDYYRAAKKIGDEEKIAKYEYKMLKAKRKDDKKYGTW